MCDTFRKDFVSETAPRRMRPAPALTLVVQHHILRETRACDGPRSRKAINSAPRNTCSSFHSLTEIRTPTSHPPLIHLSFIVSGR